MDGSIDKGEYNASRGKIDGTIEELNEKIEGVQSGGVLKKEQEALLADIANAVDELANGVEYDDEFYRSILDKMVIVDEKTIDVYLNILPERWRFTVSKATAPIYKRNISEARKPISRGKAWRSVGLNSGGWR